MNNRVKNSKQVTFQEDFTSKKGLVIYAKDSTHFIHTSIVEKLKKLKVKMKVESIDYEKAISDAKSALRKQKKAQEEANK